MRRLLIALVVSAPLLSGCIIIHDTSPDDSRGLTQTR
jgi:hypothetical protein